MESHLHFLSGSGDTYEISYPDTFILTVMEILLHPTFTTLRVQQNFRVSEK